MLWTICFENVRFELTDFETTHIFVKNSVILMIKDIVIVNTKRTNLMKKYDHFIVPNILLWFTINFKLISEVLFKNIFM